MSNRDDGRSVIRQPIRSRTDADRPASERVLERVAAAEGSDPADLGAQLYDAVDADALDALVAHASSELTVEFVYCGTTVLVRVDETGAVAVEAEERAATPRD